MVSLEYELSSGVKIKRFASLISGTDLDKSSRIACTLALADALLPE
jgi:hypothetical protein